MRDRSVAFAACAFAWDAGCDGNLLRTLRAVSPDRNLFVLAMAYGLWTQDRRPPRSVFSLRRHLPSVGAHICTLGWWSKTTAWGLWTWVTAYAHSDEYRLGMWGHGLRLQSLPSAAQGLFQVITAPYYLENLSRQFRPSVWDVVLSLSLLASLGLWLSLLVTALRRPKGESLRTGRKIW